MVRKRILMVEDSAIVARIQQAQLDGLHAEIQKAFNGKEALEMALFQPPDLVMVDIVMPAMDGFTLCQALKADARTAKIPLMVVTALGRDAKDRAMAAGADDFMRKPPSTLLLQRRVSNLLEIAAAAGKGRMPRKKGRFPLRVVSPQTHPRAQLLRQGGELARGEEFPSLEGLLAKLKAAPLGILALDAALGAVKIRFFVKQLREEPTLAETPVLLLHTQKELSAVEDNPPAVDDFLEKPLDAGVIRHRVELMTRLAWARQAS